jgi:hypothetical protein
MNRTPQLSGAAAGIALLLLAFGTARVAADERPSKWEFEAEPYGWLSGTYGSVTVKGHTARMAVTPSDLYGLLEDGNAFAAAGYFSVAYDRFSVFADSMGGYLEAAVNETIPTKFCTLTTRAEDKIKLAVADFALGYRLGQWSLPGRRRPLTLGVYAGARYMFFGNRLNATFAVAGGKSRSSSVFDSFAWADPMIGVRWSAPLLDSVSFDFRGDIGGFGASSQLIWGLVGTVKYWLPWTPMSIHPYLAAGYRAIDFDRSNEVGNINQQFRGPTGGMGFVF